MSAIKAAGREGGKHGGVDVFSAVGFIPGDATDNSLFISIAVADGIHGSPGHDTVSCNLAVGPVRGCWSCTGGYGDRLVPCYLRFGLGSNANNRIKGGKGAVIDLICNEVLTGALRADLLVGGSGSAGFRYKTMNESPNSFNLRDQSLDSACNEPNEATDVPVVAANPLLGGIQAFVWKGPIGSPLALAFGTLGYTRVVGAPLRSGVARPLWISACGSTATAL